MQSQEDCGTRLIWNIKQKRTLGTIYPMNMKVIFRFTHLWFLFSLVSWVDPSLTWCLDLPEIGKNTNKAWQGNGTFFCRTKFQVDIGWSIVNYLSGDAIPNCWIFKSKAKESSFFFNISRSVCRVLARIWKVMVFFSISVKRHFACRKPLFEVWFFLLMK